MRTAAFILSAAGLAAACLAAGPALAAPQPLALVATLGPVELKCDGRECAAEFSAFCLQEDRGSPRRGHAYQPVGAIGVVARDAEGRERALPVELLEARALRTHVAVRLSVSESALRERGLSRPAVTVGDGASLAPAAVAGDPRPLGADELAMATGPLRSVGTRVVDLDGERMPAARIVNLLLNALPQQAAAEPREALWRRVAEPALAGLPEAAVQRAKAIHDLCQLSVQTGVDPSLRRCLEGRHDSLVGGLNGAYWRAVKTGS
jgi:hypothetical protein